MQSFDEDLISKADLEAYTHIYTESNDLKNILKASVLHEYCNFR